MARQSLFPGPDDARPLLSGDHYFPTDTAAFSRLFPRFPEGGTVRPTALLLPHGGEDQIRNSVSALWREVDLSGFDACLIIAPVHREPEPVLALPPLRGFETPFGEVAVDRGGADRICAEIKSAEYRLLPFLEEPAFDLILTLIAAEAPKLPVLPVFAGGEEPGITADLRSLIDGMRARRRLVILSVNLSPSATALCGAQLYSLVTELFREHPVKWYAEEGPGYPSAAWLAEE